MVNNGCFPVENGQTAAQSQQQASRQQQASQQQASQQAAEQTQQAAQAQQTVPVTGWRGLHTQMLFIALTILASILAIMVLQGIEEQQSGCYPGKNYRHLTAMTRVSQFLVAVSAVYFLWLAYQDRKNDPSNKWLNWLTLANIFAAGAVIIKLEVTNLTLNTQNPEVIEEEVE